MKIRPTERLKRKAVFWWVPKDGVPNVGDHLAYNIARDILKLHDKSILDKRCLKNKLLTVGSVLHFAKNGDAVWGTGINGKKTKDSNKFESLDCRAVRGPYTREWLAINKGIECPEVYGDPAIILPLLYPKALLTDSQPRKEYIVISHMNDDMGQYEKYAQHLVSPRQYPSHFIRDILEAKLVISSSLHGLIIAEAYGIPALFYDSNSGESMFKYDDYYSGTNRNKYTKVTSIDEALSQSIESPPDLTDIALKLYKHFPVDLWL